MILHPIRFERDDVGRVGIDASGRRFVVLQPSTMIAGCEEVDDPNWIATLPDPSTGVQAGDIIHASHLKAPIKWEEGAQASVLSHEDRELLIEVACSSDMPLRLRSIASRILDALKISERT